MEIRTKKALGQHFLQDEGILNDIVDQSGITGSDSVLEIGPGSGNMTVLLATKAGRLTAVEIDRSLEPILRTELAPYTNTACVFGDFLTLSNDRITELTGGPFKVVANLPYYLTTPILERLTDPDLPVTALTVLIQRETAERILCGPGNREYGPLSVACARWGEGRILFRVPSSAFLPPPKVESAVLQLVRHPEDPFGIADYAFFRRVVETTFTRRRKQLKNTLGGLDIGPAEAETALRTAGIDPSRRPETLSVGEFARLAAAIKAH